MSKPKPTPEDIAALPSSLQRCTYFLNVSPEVMEAQTFLSAPRIVIEITERASIGDYDKFETLVRHYTSQGFDIALDDFGSGNSGLRTLISCVPHYLKLDMSVTRRVDREPYKQRIVRSMVEFAQNIGAVLIAEGVETWQEADALIGCGVEWAQGFLFARPMPRPQLLSRAVSTRVMRAWGRRALPPSLRKRATAPSLLVPDTARRRRTAATHRSVRSTAPARSGSIARASSCTAARTSTCTIEMLWS